MAIPIKMLPLGDRAILIRLGESIDEANFRKVQAVLRRLEQTPHAAIVECVPAFTTVTVYYEPLRASFDELCLHLESFIGSIDPLATEAARLVEIPVCYGGEFGPDLAFVAQQHDLSEPDVIAIHYSVDYLVHMIGFVPGFPYLGGLPEKIQTPRKRTPRLRVPAGSVGIAGAQTGIYPLATPGGWQLIGRTPLALFRPQERPPSLLAAGDVVRFYSISASEFGRLCEYA